MDKSDAKFDATGADSLGPLIKVANTLIEKELNNRVASMFEGYSLTGPQITLMVYLHDAHGHAVTQREIADRFVLSHPTIRGIVKRLESAGLIKTSQLESDRRQILLELTPEGRRLMDVHIDDIHGVMEQINAMITEGLTGAEQKKLVAALKRIVANFSDGASR
ncbi:MarR family winged helix-turn-helix transcriptional regulator [Bifidobacterium sp. ESL0769]|uniref:MarR family winged helix-turn-helix transcriptional regulator n=1 Tax=Bifidobacterium sp. ESL0769 TaxID=2983229 RepID=UPI0023F73149|nr:MarR family winged helix-turn-helix transcriptional regulator [Bifidobacterium sp. ESL0769]WEV67138.1 MarR family winged helix-turn-helix transcriptional regulator [Bifidobacterium sp. ESL0769]